MIKYIELRFGNAFSYGAGNTVRLDESPLVQLVGKNGHGKSSIGLILEEVQFNTNSKGIKKANILNRYVKDKSYWIELDFNKDDTKYTIRTVRTNSTGTVTLTRNGVDISSHTSTGTYKSIEQILGYDHKTFSQIVYQSSVSSLEFLVASDTARKKFLIELLNLTKYTKASEVFKELASTLSKDIDVTQGKINTVKSWLTKYEKEDLSIWPLATEPAELSSDKIVLLNNELLNLEATNKKITQNNTYKTILSGITLLPSAKPPNTTNLMELKVTLAEVNKKLKTNAHLVANHTGPIIKCPTCSQDMDNSTMYNMVQEYAAIEPSLKAKVVELTAQIAAIEAEVLAYSKSEKQIAEWEKYHALVDASLSDVLLDRSAIVKEISVLQTEVYNNTAAILKIRKANSLAEAHNAKVAVVCEQLSDMRRDLASLTEEVALKTSELSNLQVLVKAFSTTGLVAYKIECLVKDLEEITNEYLGVLASGRFQLSFKIASADKLNVVITDNGRDIDITALSSGERARVNVATLLAIRKLMQTLSNSRTNLLILDETVENLDTEGKDKLIEVLLEESSLNTFLISHGFSHPLLEKISIVKENNVSRIE